MKFLTDENIGFKIVEFLRSKKHDVISVVESFTSENDSTILTIAKKEKRILITSDKDFGELVYLKGLSPYGVILFRLRDESVKNKVKVLNKLLKKYEKRLKKNFTVVTESQVRLRKL